MAKIELIQKFPIGGIVNQKTDLDVNIVKGHLNKVMLVFPNGIENRALIEAGALSVKHISDRITNQATKIPFRAFIDISDEKNGSVSGQASELAVLADEYNGGGGADEALNDAFSAIMLNETLVVLVDLGSYRLSDGDELHVSFERPNGTTNPACEIYSISDQPNEPFSMITYNVDYDQNELHRNVKELYIIQTTSVKNDGCDLFIDSLSSQYQTTNTGALAYAMISGRFEQANPEVFKIFETGVPEDVAVKIVGAPSGEVGVLAVRIQSDIKKYHQQKKFALKEQAQIVENLERNQPETAAVLQANGMPTSYALEIKSNEF